MDKIVQDKPKVTDRGVQNRQNKPTQNKPKISTRAKFIIIAILFCIMLFLYFGLPVIGQDNMRIQPTGHIINFTFDSNPSFHSNDSRNFFFVTRDTMRHHTSDGNIRWHENLGFARPVSVSNGDFVAVAEHHGGQLIIVYDTTGEIFRLNFDHQISFFSINKTGFLSVILQYDSGHGIFVFNRQSVATARQDLFYYSFHQGPLMIPNMVEVSPDGRYIAIAIIDLNLTLSSSVQFRYLNERDARGTDRGLIAGQSFSGQIITTMQFMNNNRLVLATASQIMGIQLGPQHATMQEVWTLELGNNLTHLEFYGGDRFAFVTGNAMVGDVNPVPVGMLYIYDINGVQMGNFNVGRRATHLRMGHNTVLVGAGRTFHAVDSRGHPLWEFTALHDVIDILFLGDTNTILIAGTTQAEVWQRRRVRNEEL